MSLLPEVSSETLPEILRIQWQQRWEQFERVVAEEDRQWLEKNLADNTLFKQNIKRLWACSEFIAASCRAQPQLLQQLQESGALDNCSSHQQMDAELQADMQSVANNDDLMKVLRQFRQRQMVRIVWRDFTRQASMVETTAEMTFLAEVVLQQTLEFLYQQACEEKGTPYGSNGEKQGLLVLGMGKLGACELNVSSDIDLIFCYPEAGETRWENQGSGKVISNQEFFVALGQQLIKALDLRTVDGFVFRVDMRLRPYGQSGVLVLNFDAMEEYYQTQGRDWERYAMIKARVVAGDRAQGARLMQMLRPFTYRKYIDFTAIEALRDMKALINREVQRKGMNENIKRGAGGIREVEFIAQAFQIIRGGRDRRFQEPSLLVILKLLDAEELLPAGKADLLTDAYTFLRNVEHVLQGFQDKQTQQLPRDDLGQQRLAFLMGAADWNGFMVQLNERRKNIREVFEGIIAAPDEDGLEMGPQEGYQQALNLWELLHDCDGVTPQVLSLLESLAYDKAGLAAETLLKLMQGKAFLSLPATSRNRLEALMPSLVCACGKVSNSTETLMRILPLVEAVFRRSAYLLLLVENPKALQSLVTLSSASPWVAMQLALHPALLDELLDKSTLYSLPNQADLDDELRQQLLRVPEDDLESLMETLRYFRLSHSLRVAACEIEGTLPLMQVSDYLTWLAEAILSHAFRLSWRQMVERYGRPVGTDGDEAGFLIVGYGKLGGIEMGHGSDLDIVFIYDAKLNSFTDGERCVDVSTFFTRLGQRMIHFLTTQTVSGALYEVDMRLRPSGQSGMLVTSVAAFEKYQHEGAWIWEHQALVRGRPVVGSGELAVRFENIRKRVLCQKRNAAELKSEVCSMRQKMLSHLASKPSVEGERQMFDLKYDRGGIVDIEFLVQYHVLLYAHQHPDLVKYTYNIRILDAMAKSQLLSADTTQLLKDAYIFYRSMGHRLNLQGVGNTAAYEELEGYPKQVADIWQQIME